MLDSKNNNILRVNRTKAQAKRNYDKIIRFYDCFAGGVESHYRNIGLEQLNIKGGEQSLREAGFKIINSRKVKVFGLPLEIVTGNSPTLPLN